MAEAVVAHLVHETVEQSGGAVLVHSELTTRRVVITLLDVSSVRRGPADTYHPQELVDICCQKKPSIMKFGINQQFKNYLILRCWKTLIDR